MQVSEINEYIKRIISFDPILNSVLIEGEISNFKLHSSGHAYFSLKDNKSKINCVMFRSQFETVDFIPEDGQKVKISGSVSVYERDGRYQLYVETMIEVGTGELFRKFLLLKDELNTSGYFEKSKQIPKFPKRIGVVTSPTGAAIKDILTVLKRRNKFVDVVVYPVHVQGEMAKFEISTAIDYFNESKAVDIIIISRGGGSLEELWAFNELMVAESIYASSIPVISGVGHETDFTISDFVSDRRAATPSEAAELSVSSHEIIIKELHSKRIRLNNGINSAMNLKYMKLNQYSSKRLCKLVLNNVQNKRTELNVYKVKLLNNIKTVLDNKSSSLNSIGVKLNSISPLNTLDRGYAIIEKDGKSVNTIDDIEKSDLIDIILNNGIIKGEVISKERNILHDQKK